jgi:4-alpha-glucanotransferase
MQFKASGILLHITSLPSRFGIGDLGPDAYNFVDFLIQTGQKYWQILPLSITDPSTGNSPYNSLSAFAGNKYLISLDLLIHNGLLEEWHIHIKPDFNEKCVEFNQVIDFKESIFNIAYEAFKDNEIRFKHDFTKFTNENSYWLEDYSVFISLRDHFKNRSWSKWPYNVRIREIEQINKLKKQLENRIDREKFLQFIFFKQWFLLKTYCNESGIKIIGDMPFYVDFNSADVWSNPEMFKIDKDLNLTHKSGVPPDYFSKTGQLWGNPIYDWDLLKKQNYLWWLNRIRQNFTLFDLVRFDHFRGFASFWEVPAGERTAAKGYWVPGPGEDFFTSLSQHFDKLPLIAEDLGYITPDVIELRDKLNLPGLKVLLFAFTSENGTNPYLPHNYEENCIVYTGTHDNNTVKGWYINETSDEQKELIKKYLGKDSNQDNINLKLIKFALSSPARIAIIPMQDILGLGQDARMNTPGKRVGNWCWRLKESELSEKLINDYRNLIVEFCRGE